MTRATRVCEALDPVLVPAGFAAGQHPADEPELTVQVLFCGDPVRLALDHPWLEDLRPRVEFPRSCWDLVVEVDAEDRLVRVDLEEDPLPDVVAAAGRAHDSRRAARLVGEPSDDALAGLREVLRGLLRGGSPDWGARRAQW